MAIKQNNKTNNKRNNDSQSDEGYIKVSLVNQSVFIRKKKSCPLKAIDISDIKYTDLNLINKFISERGRIAPSRVTNVEVKKQRVLAQAIKRARHLALISPIKKEIEN